MHAVRSVQLGSGGIVLYSNVQSSLGRAGRAGARGGHARIHAATRLTVQRRRGDGERKVQRSPPGYCASVSNPSHRIVPQIVVHPTAGSAFGDGWRYDAGPFATLPLRRTQVCPRAITGYRARAEAPRAHTTRSSFASPRAIACRHAGQHQVHGRCGRPSRKSSPGC